MQIYFVVVSEFTGSKTHKKTSIGRQVDVQITSQRILNVQRTSRLGAVPSGKIKFTHEICLANLCIYLKLFLHCKFSFTLITFIEHFCRIFFCVAKIWHFFNMVKTESVKSHSFAHYNKQTSLFEKNKSMISQSVCM